MFVLCAALMGCAADDAGPQGDTRSVDLSGGSAGATDPADTMPGPRSTEHSGAESGVPEDIRGRDGGTVVGDLDFANCSTRLLFADALELLISAPFDDPEPAQTLRRIVPATDLELAWEALLDLVDASHRQGAHPDETSDRAVFDLGIQALQVIDTHVLSTSCDATGLPDSFGCGAPLEDCAALLASDAAREIASPAVRAALLTAATVWEPVACTEIEWRRVCDLRSVSGPESRAEVDFASTNDDRVFAWSITVFRSV